MYAQPTLQLATVDLRHVPTPTVVSVFGETWFEELSGLSTCTKSCLGYFEPTILNHLFLNRPTLLRVDIAFDTLCLIDEDL